MRPGTQARRQTQNHPARACTPLKGALTGKPVWGKRRLWQCPSWLFGSIRHLPIQPLVQAWLGLESLYMTGTKEAQGAAYELRHMVESNSHVARLTRRSCLGICGRLRVIMHSRNLLVATCKLEMGIPLTRTVQTVFCGCSTCARPAEWISSDKHYIDIKKPPKSAHEKMSCNAAVHFCPHLGPVGLRAKIEAFCS